MSHVDDEEYAAQLLAILTNPPPAVVHPVVGAGDPHRQAEDGIDRHDGFGRDVWVESATVVDGPHGAEVVIGFGLDIPAGRGLDDVPRTGSLRLPVDATWRELSGYAEPAAYAPEVARRVQVAAGKHVQAHRGGVRRAPSDGPGRAELWRLLLDALGDEGDVQEVAPGRIELRDDDGALVTLVVTAEEWERVWSEHAYGDVEMYLAELLGPRQEDETFVVCYENDLVRSTREQLPPVRGRALELRLARIRAEHPDGRFAWHAYPPKRPD